jgi:hypothetical protein
MKLLLENWRQYLAEQMEEPITTLRIFDFDETIAHTRSETRVIAPDNSRATLTSQKEFEDYMSEAAETEGIVSFDPVRELQELGYQIDLSDFSIVKDPEEITVVTDIMREFPPDSKTYVMTARRGGALGPILDYIDKIGIDSFQIRPIATQGESKGAVIANMIGQKIMPDGKSNIHRIEYYEDSDKNIQDVKNSVCNNPGLDEIKPEDFELIIYKVEKVENEKVENEYRLEPQTC